MLLGHAHRGLHCVQVELRSERGIDSKLLREPRAVTRRDLGVHALHLFEDVEVGCEPRDRACPTGWSSLVLAPVQLSLEDQYRHLAPKLSEPAKAAQLQEALASTTAEMR